MIDLRKLPATLYVLAGIGGILGAFAGYILCFGYDVIHGPWFPQAGADLNPAGWIGWWIAAGGLAGAACGSVFAAFLLGLWRLFVGRKVEGSPK
jgi:4-amino-4-deoxy-L-arabinose transferase-like glycosyltransferase